MSVIVRGGGTKPAGKRPTEVDHFLCRAGIDCDRDIGATVCLVQCGLHASVNLRRSVGPAFLMVCFALTAGAFETLHACVNDWVADGFATGRPRLLERKGMRRHHGQPSGPEQCRRCRCTHAKRDLCHHRHPLEGANGPQNSKMARPMKDVAGGAQQPAIFIRSIPATRGASLRGGECAARLMTETRQCGTSTMTANETYTEPTTGYWQDLTPEIPARFSATPPYRFGYPGQSALRPHPRSAAPPIARRQSRRRLPHCQPGLEHRCCGAGRPHGQHARALDAEIIVGLPTLGLAFASLVAERLGQPRYVPLGYSRKFWYDDALSEPVASITSPEAGKQLRLDPNLLPLIEGLRVALVDDAISTGATAVAAVRLLQRSRRRSCRHDCRHEANQSLGGAGRGALLAACRPRGLRVPTIPAQRRWLDTPHRHAARRSLGSQGGS